MKNLPVYGGLDYHQGSIQVCVLDRQGHSLTNRRCRSDLAEAVEVIRACGEVRSIAIESCCGAAEFADQLRQVTGWEVRLAHPGYVNRMKHNPDKSDHSDARLLADLGRVGYIPEVWLPPRAIRELRTLVRRRQAAVDRRKATKLRILSLLRARRIKRPDGVGRPWTRIGDVTTPCGKLCAPGCRHGVETNITGNPTVIVVVAALVTAGAMQLWGRGAVIWPL